MAGPDWDDEIHELAQALAMLATGVAMVVFGVSYIGMCEWRATEAKQCDTQWLTGFSLVFGGGTTTVGTLARPPRWRRRREENEPGLEPESPGEEPPVMPAVPPPPVAPPAATTPAPAPAPRPVPHRWLG